MGINNPKEKGPAAAAVGRGSEILLCSENRLWVGSISGAQRKVPKFVKVWISFVQAGRGLQSEDQ